MKLGIVTQPLLGNYGGLMQNYALQQVLLRMGHEPVTIDYIWNIKWPRYVLTTLKTALLWLVPGKRRAFAEKFPKRTNPLTDAFVKDHIATTGYVYSYRPGTLRRYGIEALVTGSDQVWRPRYNPDLPDMYLDFARRANIRKIAYAASFGTAEHEYTPEQIERCRPAARRLHAVGVREQGAVKLCKDYFDIDAQQVLDPTLLLSKEDYEELTRDIPVAKERYVGVYVLDDSPEIDRVLPTVSEQLGGLPIKRVDVKTKTLSPQEWLCLFRDAEYIVTDSFHGTVFSIIFGKPFLTFYNHERGADRFLSLLEPLGLADRLTEQGKDDISAILSRPIDRTAIAEALKLRKEEAIRFIKESLA